jgi:hypothetical protein
VHGHANPLAATGKGRHQCHAERIAQQSRHGWTKFAQTEGCCPNSGKIPRAGGYRFIDQARTFQNRKWRRTSNSDHASVTRQLLQRA